MDSNSIVSLRIHSYTLIASISQGVVRIVLQINHNDEAMYISPRFSEEYFPQELQILFEDVTGFYEYLYQVVVKNMAERINFQNGVLKIKVLINDKIRQLPIRMKKMIQQKQNFRDQQFMLTSIASEMEERRQSRISSKAMSKIEKDEYPAPRLRLMMLRESSKMKKAMTKIPELSSSSATQVIRQYPYVKPQTIHRYEKHKTQQHSPAGYKSYSQGKPYKNSKSLNLKNKTNQTNLDLSNKDLKVVDIKQIVSNDWTRLNLLNLGYNNIGSDGLKLLTTIKWPVLKTLYVCFNNIYKIQWIPANICFLKTLSLSGNKIKEIPRNIIQLQFLQQLFIYNNKIQVIPQELTLLEQLKNLSIYGNKLDLAKSKKTIAKLKSRKVQVWE